MALLPPCAPDACPEPPPVLPSLAGLNLLAALDRQVRSLRFMAEHTQHSLVSEGVADAVHDAYEALAAAQRLQADLCWGTRDGGQL